MIKIKKFITKFFLSNTYIIYSEKTKNSFIIDIGDFTNEMLEFILKEKLKIIYLILTHEHFDHINGINKIKEKHKDIKTISSEECSQGLQDASLNLSKYTGVSFQTESSDILIENLKNNQINFEQNIIEFYKLPGHSPGSIGIYFENKLFIGDTIIKGYKTVTKIKGASKEKLKESINFIFKKFSKDTVVYPGHGEIFRLSEVKEKEII